MKPREWASWRPMTSLVILDRFWRPLATCLLMWAGAVRAADLVIRIPGDLSQQDGFYRLDYRNVK